MAGRKFAWTVYVGLMVSFFACSGSGSGGLASPQSGVSNAPSSQSAAVSSGAITAFGSVFVNGNEYSTAGAKLVDDDTGAVSTSVSGLEVGMVLDVVLAKGGSGSNPTAGELHVHPLARGYVDASDTTAGTLTVMGQTVQITSATNFSDHRACVSARTCTAITGQSGLTATTGSGTSAVAGTYVTIHGYLFAASSSAGGANIVASLVSVADAPTSSTGGVHFKAEGVVTATGSSSATIGTLSVDLSNARCFVSGEKVSCAAAFSTGQVASVSAAAAPSLPATTFAADSARLSSRIPVYTPGTSVEFDGAVSSVTTSPAAFAVRGINIDASALPAGSSLPAVGDIVRVLGTIASDGQSVTATSVTVLHAARSATYGFEGDVSKVATGTAVNTFVLTLLGQNITVNSTTRLADRSTKSWDREDLENNPFNINTFQTYLAASASQHVLVSAEADASGNLTALSLTIVPASTTSGLTGVVDASPAPFNSAATGTPSTFDVYGVAISADPAAIFQGPVAFPLFGGKPVTIASGNLLIVRGTFSTGTLTVTATPSLTNSVIDLGVPVRRDLDNF